MPAGWDDYHRVLGNAEIEFNDRRLGRLLGDMLSRFPRSEKPIRSVSGIQVRRKGRMRGLVGLTTYFKARVGAKSSIRENGFTQKISFYSEIFDRLSDSAVIGVIAHELAHSWLNEHVSPEASKRREKEADDLARRWGYGTNLDALESEADSI